MTTLRATLAVALFLTGLCARAEAPSDQQIADTYIRQMADFVAIALEDMDPAQPGICYPKFFDDHFQTPGYVMAFLYKTRHPLNPYYGDEKIRATAIAISDRIAESKTTLEWPLYSICETLVLLRGEVDEERILKYKEYARHYISIRGRRPYIYTSFNHDAWNATAILRAGQVFGEQPWVERGKRLMAQMLKIQTELGYFDEGPHHGPSMRYNQVQLTSMLRFHDLTGDPEALAASKRLADFMIRYSFPDGTPMGAFDGRQSYYLGYYGPLVYGFDRWPLGKRTMRRLYETREKRDILDMKKPWHHLSDFYGYFGAGFLVDEYRALLSGASEKPLPQESNGYVLDESGPSFNGGYARNHDWVVALSAIDSDVPVMSDSPYRLSRQSRLDVWHEKTGLLIGGGHSVNHVETPLANFVVETGYKDVQCDFGFIQGGSLLDRQGLYFPRAVSAKFSATEQVLEENFGQGNVYFVVKPVDEKRLEIHYRYDLFGVKRLFVQLPLVVFHGNQVLVDGAVVAADRAARVVRDVEMHDPVMGATLRITAPQDAELRLRETTLPLRWYHDDYGAREQRWKPAFGIRLLSLRVDSPDGKGAGKFVLEIEN